MQRPGLLAVFERDINKYPSSSNYQQAASHYSSADTDDMKGFVKGVLERCRVARVLDIGANIGTYLLLAAGAPRSVIPVPTLAAKFMGATAIEMHFPGRLVHPAQRPSQSS